MRRLAFSSVLLLTAWAANHAMAVTVMFEDLITGTVFNPTDVFNSNGVDMTVTTSAAGGGTVQIQTGSPIGSGNVAGIFGDRLLSFAVPAATTFSSFEFATFGGNSTLIVNGASAALPIPGAFPLGGTNVVITSTGAGQADVTIDGVITDLVIGGEEFNLDNITLVPEPSAFVLLAGGGAILAFCRRRKGRFARRAVSC